MVLQNREELAKLPGVADPKAVEGLDDDGIDLPRLDGTQEPLKIRPLVGAVPAFVVFQPLVDFEAGSLDRLTLPERVLRIGTTPEVCDGRHKQSPRGNLPSIIPYPRGGCESLLGVAPPAGRRQAAETAGRQQPAGVQSHYIKPPDPGLHVDWPLTTEVEVIVTARQTLAIPDQVLATKDGKKIVVKTLVVYKIHLAVLHDPDRPCSTMLSVAQVSPQASCSPSAAGVKRSVKQAHVPIQGVGLQTG